MTHSLFFHYISQIGAGPDWTGHGVADRSGCSAFGTDPAWRRRNRNAAAAGLPAKEWPFLARRTLPRTTYAEQKGPTASWPTCSVYSRGLAYEAASLSPDVFCRLFIATIILVTQGVAGRFGVVGL